ncbi:Major facilitator superfamily domain, general substrate transporter [Cordyceps fumosorosea ARSEF 2679]|uniref:Major facilitator superfamily domain, general substrate transporter n=1 Tax=Cordyceps fumosorosea (strain ARSEF 2679) TaxID=1081104 RepID=A0A162MAG2_CORFA|nr:Major facilitator superfamily domain, general substrate transporter [Cordyceps fumosorosea ARSEF 2679]OAA53360.1 Major facilitator superfamily domain, general substrate transporter [Cordyceps fumosorosea ARSEF 2679]
MARTSLADVESGATTPMYSGPADSVDNSPQRQSEKLEAAVTVAADEPPDGGRLAWTHALLMHIVFFNTWGVVNGYGVFQDYYTAALARPPSDIAWIGSVGTFLLFGVGVASGRATDAGYFSHVFRAGVFLELLGVFMTSLGTRYWHLFLSQAVCMGVGNGLVFCPALAILSQYFKRRRAFAVGLAAAGAAVGGLVYPILINRLIFHDKVGFGWTMRCMGLVMLVTYIPCLVLFKPRLPPRKTADWIDTTAFKDVPFILFTISMFFAFWGLYFAFFFLGTFARDRIGVAQPIYLLILLNGVGVIGRISPTIVADKWCGPLNLVIAIGLVSSLLVYCWAAVDSSAGLYVFAVIYGLAAAALQALYPAVATTMTPHPSKTGTRVGMILFFVSFANLTGPAISGAIIERSNGSYLGAQMFAATSILLAAAFAVATKVAKAGWKLRTKV